MQLGGARTGKRAVVCEQLELDGLTYPFDLEVWFGDRVAVLGANGTGKSHFLRLLARGGTDPEPGAVPASGAALQPVAHEGVARLGARVRPGHFSQTHDRPELMARTLLDVLVGGDVDRDGHDPGRRDAPPRPLRARRARPTSGSAPFPAASRPGCRSCCWSARAPRCCCSTSRPTTSTSPRPRRWSGRWTRSRAR